jgi:hypothetical protein
VPGSSRSCSSRGSCARSVSSRSTPTPCPTSESARGGRSRSWR